VRNIKQAFGYLVVWCTCTLAAVQVDDLALKDVVSALQDARPERITIYLFTDDAGKRPFQAFRLDRQSEMATFLAHFEASQKAAKAPSSPCAARLLFETKDGLKWSFSIFGKYVAGMEVGMGGSRTGCTSSTIATWLFDRLEAGEHSLADEEKCNAGIQRYATLTGSIGLGEAASGFAKGNLLANGDFEQATAGKEDPTGWDRVNKLTTFWTDDPDNTGRGMVIKMDTDVYAKELEAREKEMASGGPVQEKPKTFVQEKHQYQTIGATYGVSYYSDPIPVKLGQAYRITLDEKGLFQKDFAAKVWVRGYGKIELNKGDFRDRRLFDFYMNMRNKDNRWKTWSAAFHPTKNTPAVKEIRVMLYAYWPRGTYYFDNVRVEAISMDEYRRAKKEERTDIR